MSDAEYSVSQHLSDCRWELKNAKHVGDGRAVPPHHRCNRLLSVSKFSNELVVSLRFFDWIEVTTLEIFNQGETEQLAIVDIFDNRADVMPAKLGRCPQPSLAGDQLVSSLVTCFSQCDRLQESR